MKNRISKIMMAVMCMIAVSGVTAFADEAAEAAETTGGGNGSMWMWAIALMFAAIILFKGGRR